MGKNKVGLAICDKNNFKFHRDFIYYERNKLIHYHRYRETEQLTYNNYGISIKKRLK